MISLPLYIIEHVNSKWVLYNTLSCLSIEFDTKSEAETKLKSLLT